MLFVIGEAHRTCKLFSETKIHASLFSLLKYRTKPPNACKMLRLGNMYEHLLFCASNQSSTEGDFAEGHQHYTKIMYQPVNWMVRILIQK